MNTAQLLNVLATVPRDTPVSAISPGDPSVGIWDAAYPVARVTETGALALDVAAPSVLDAGTLYDALAANRRPKHADLTAEAQADERTGTDAYDVERAYYVPAISYEYGDVDAAYFEIVLSE
jgi:hypothetical protein